MQCNSVVFLCVVSSFVAVTVAQLYPSRSIPISWFDNDAESMASELNVASERQDMDESPTNEHHHGRVQIKVYRGPDTHDEHEHFAPYGYWVKQPADTEHHK